MKKLGKKSILATLSLAMAFTAFGSVGSVNAFAAEEHTHTFTNGFCETVAGETHYEEPTLNNNGTESDTTDDYYEIGNAGQLYWFAEHVNYREGNEKPNIAANAKLTADIVVNEDVIVNGELNEAKKDTFRTWNPIGYFINSTTYHNYGGTFDGQGYSVSGLFYENSAQPHVGFFGRASRVNSSSSVTIKNFGVIDSYFCAKSSVGAIVGVSDFSVSVTNCYSENNYIYAANLTTDTSDSVAGGIVGSLLNGSSIRNCYSTSTVKGTKRYVGSIVGSVGSYTMENCYYLSGAAIDSKGVVQNGRGYGQPGSTQADKEGESKGFATVKEVVMAYGGEDAYLQYLERQIPQESKEYVEIIKNRLENTNKANADEIERLQGELDLAEQALAEAKTALENADKANADEIERLQGELDLAEQALAEAKTALENADKANAGEIERLQGELEAKEQDLEKSDTANKTLGIVGLAFGVVSFVGMAAMAVFTFLKRKQN